MRILPPLLLALLLSPLSALGQTGVELSGLRQDTSLPVTVKADQLSVSQKEGRALFTGHVLITQGQMQITADEVAVEYGANQAQIANLSAKGGVTFTHRADTITADEALYTIDSGEVVMKGAVTLTQGPTRISGARLVVHLKTGTAQMEGGVETLFTPGGN